MNCGTRLNTDLKAGGGYVYVNANSYVDIDIAFDTPFDILPCIIVNGGHDGKGSAAGASIVSVNTTGFKAKVYNETGNGGSIYYRWIAMPYKS